MFKKASKMLEWEGVRIAYLLVASVRELTLSHGLISGPVYHQHPDRWSTTHDEPHHLLQVLPLHHLSIHLDNHITFTESCFPSTATCCHLLGWDGSHEDTFLLLVLFSCFCMWLFIHKHFSITQANNLVNITICPLNHLSYTLVEGWDYFNIPKCTMWWDYCMLCCT